MPTAFAFIVGTWRVILSFSNVIRTVPAYVSDLFLDLHDPADAMRG